MRKQSTSAGSRAQGLDADGEATRERLVEDERIFVSRGHASRPERGIVRERTAENGVSVGTPPRTACAKNEDLDSSNERAGAFEEIGEGIARGEGRAAAFGRGRTRGFEGDADDAGVAVDEVFELLRGGGLLDGPGRREPGGAPGRGREDARARVDAIEFESQFEQGFPRGIEGSGVLARGDIERARRAARRGAAGEEGEDRGEQEEGGPHATVPVAGEAREDRARR